MVFNSKEEFSEKWDYIYDENDNQISIEKFSIKELGFKLTFEYDKYGNVTEKTYYHSNGTIAESTSFEYSYDKKGNWIKQVVFIDSEPSYIVEREIEYYQ